jgi:asparagine synthase (glutamine-hydrolysing)
LLNPEVWAAGAAGLDPVAHIAQRADAGGGGALFEWVSRAELSVYTHHQLLRDTDAMSMAHSLEVRVPLLDHLLVEAALRLPAVIKQAGTGPKPLLVAALGDLLPPAIRDRQEKRGFTFPFAVWMGTTLREHLETALEQATGLGLLQPKAVHALWAGFRAGRVHWSRPWSLAALGAWSHAAGLTHP